MKKQWVLMGAMALVMLGQTVVTAQRQGDKSSKMK
jgi:hypothetical protein